MMVVFCCGMCLEGRTGISRMAGPGRPGENFREGWARMSETAGREISGRPGRDGRAARAVRDANTPARKLLFHPTGRMRAFVHYNPKFSQRFCAMSRLKLIVNKYIVNKFTFFVSSNICFCLRPHIGPGLAGGPGLVSIMILECLDCLGPASPNQWQCDGSHARLTIHRFCLGSGWPRLNRSILQL